MLIFMWIIGVLLPSTTAEVARITGDNDSINRFHQLAHRKGSTETSLLLNGYGWRVNAEILQDFPVLESILLYSDSDVNRFVIDPDAFQFNDRLQSIHLKVVEFPNATLPYLTHLHNLTTLELYGIAQKITLTKDILNIPTLTSLILQGLDMIIDNDAFENLHNLKTLTLDHFNLKRVPASLIKLPHLQSLSIRRSISELQPEDVAEFADNLESLDLSNNRLKKAPKLPLMNRLKKLDLSSNNITDLAIDFFESTPNLTEIYLSDNNISIVSMQSLTRLNNLVALDLSQNQLETFNLTYSKGQTQLLEFLSLSRNRLKRLRIDRLNGTLYFSGNRLERISKDTFAAGCRFSSLELAFNPIKTIDDGAFKGVVLPAEFQLSNIAIDTFNLSSLDGSEQLVKLIIRDNKSFRHIAIGSSSSSSIELPKTLQTIRLYCNPKFLLSDPDGKLAELSTGKFMLELGCEFTCVCRLKSLLEQKNPFVQVNYDVFATNCSNAERLSVKAFIDQNDKYCNKGILTEAFRRLG